MTLASRLASLFPRALLARVLPVWLLACVLLLATNASSILAGRYPDPDDQLRLVQVRDLLAGQPWYDLTQHRIDPLNGGVPMHWSRLVDLPIAVLILMLAPLIGTAAAELSAAIAIPLVTFGLAMLVAGRIAWRRFGSEAATFACLAMALAVPLVGQMRPLRIDHHGWQVVLALIAVGAVLMRRPRLGGWLAGGALAAWLAVSLEGLPMTAAVAGVAALHWLRDGDRGVRLASLLQGLAVGSAVLFGATRGLGDLAAHCDAVSPAHLAAMAWAALAATALAASPVRHGPWIALGLGAIGATSLASFSLAAPHCAGATFDMLDPVVRQFWYQNVGEGLPIWRQDIPTALQCLIPPLIALWATRKLGLGAVGAERRWWTDYGLLLGGATALTIVVTRGAAVAAALAAIPLGWQLTRWLGDFREQASLLRKAAIVGSVTIALLPASPWALLSLARPAVPGNAASIELANSAGQAPGRASSCRIPEAAASLRALPKGNILAPLDIGPRLLLETRHTVVATGHHRGAKAMREVIDAFRGDAANARELTKRRSIDYLVFCPDLAEPGLYAYYAPNGFAAQLRRGQVPDWLEPVALPAGANLRVWKVKP